MLFIKLDSIFKYIKVCLYVESIKNFVLSIFDVYSFNWSSLWAVIMGLCGFLFGGADSLLIALVIFMIIDYLTGLFYGIYSKTLSSKIGLLGFLKKFCIFLVVAVAHTLDLYILNDSELLRNATIGFYIANDGISILENVAKLGIPLPKKLKDVLIQLKDNQK